MEGDYSEISIKVKIPFHRRTSLNYTHTVSIDSQINLISTWRKSQIKFNMNLMKNIFTLGILHIVSLFHPKLYLKLYCKPCSPKESDFFYIEDINGHSTLCKSVYRRPKMMITSNNNNDFNLSKNVTFEYNAVKYEYDEKTNTITPIYFNISLLKNKDLIYKYSEGLNSEIIQNLNERYGENIMKLNRNIFYEYFIKHCISQICFTTLSTVIFCCAGETMVGTFIFFLSLIIFLIRIVFKLITFNKLYSEDYSLDGAKNMKNYKVIRKYMHLPQNKYCYIKLSEILPGDALILGENDFVPCDGIILEGECILSINYLLGNSDNILRSSLENDDNYFNYVSNKKSIIFHGMKILKIYSKNNNKEIIVLAINTGANTYKANLFSKILIKQKERKIFKPFSENVIYKYYTIFSILLLLFAICILYILYKINNGKAKNSIKNYLLIIIGFVLMPVNSIVENLIKLISIIHLNNNKIQCLDETKLTESGNIDTVIFSKSGNKNSYKIVSFCPLAYEHGGKKISFKGISESEEENISKIIDGHMSYYRRMAINMDSYDDLMGRKSFNEEMKNDELNALFLQCMICCTSLDKINNEICGEKMDKEIMEKMDWDMNSIEIRDESNDNMLFDAKEKIDRINSLIEDIKKKGNIFIRNYDSNINLNSSNTISEVFPKDYYKITEEKNINYKEKKSRTIFNKKLSEDKTYEESKIFKIIILHKFTSFSCWSKSCITYNLLDNKCRFMTKGFPDKILKYCIPKSVQDIDKILSRLIKDGYKIIAFASKIIQLNQIDKNRNEEYYMKDLTFVGFIIIEHQFNKDVSKIIEKINKMNCFKSISSVISTNENIYNAIEGGLKSGIINKNNVYVFDVGSGENEGRVIFSKFIYDKDNYNNDLITDSKDIESNISFYKSFIGEKNSQTTQNTLINQREKSTFNDELANSFQVPDSSRKMISTTNTKKIDLFENNFKNLMTFEEKDKSKREENSCNFQFPNSNKKKLSKFLGKNNTMSIQNKNYTMSDHDHDHEPEQSFNTLSRNHYKLSKTEDLLSASNSKKESKEEELENDLSLSQFFGKNKKRRPTNKSYINFNFRNNFHHNYECLYFKRYENQIRPFKHECVLCFSGRLLMYIYYLQKKVEEDKNKNKDSHEKAKYRLDILMTLLKDRVKIFYAMSSDEKNILIEIYRKYLKKSVCLVGNSASDIEPIILSNVGIMVGPPTNFNTLFCHYYLCDKNLLGIEKILKNGRSYYENLSHLTSVNSIVTLLSTILTLFTYHLNTRVSSIRCIFINLTVFLLCFSAFSIQPDYSIDTNYLVTNNKLFYIYNILKILGTAAIKVIGYVVFWKNYETNDSFSQQKNEEILVTYLFLIMWAQITSIIFAFNIQSYFRRNILENIRFIFLFFFLLEFLMVNLTLSDIYIESHIEYLFISFERNEDNADAFEDHHKILVLYVFVGDFAANYLLIKFLNICFEKLAKKNSYKRNKKIKSS